VKNLRSYIECFLPQIVSFKTKSDARAFFNYLSRLNSSISIIFIIYESVINPR